MMKRNMLTARTLFNVRARSRYFCGRQRNDNSTQRERTNKQIGRRKIQNIQTPRAENGNQSSLLDKTDPQRSDNPEGQGKQYGVADKVEAGRRGVPCIKMDTLSLFHGPGIPSITDRLATIDEDEGGEEVEEDDDGRQDAKDNGEVTRHGKTHVKAKNGRFDEESRQVNRHGGRNDVDLAESRSASRRGWSPGGNKVGGVIGSATSAP